MTKLVVAFRNFANAPKDTFRLRGVLHMQRYAERINSEWRKLHGLLLSLRFVLHCATVQNNATTCGKY